MGLNSPLDGETKSSARSTRRSRRRAKPPTSCTGRTSRLSRSTYPRRHLPLTAEDLKGIDYVYGQFSWYGPGLSYWSTGGRGGGRDAPTYWDLMVADDGKGQHRSFLANDENFAVLKELHEKNLLVPVVGNFAGPKALRAVGRYLKDRDALVSAYYLSNVEQYLSREGLLDEFCANAAQLPLDPASTFIRSVRNSTYGPGIGLDSVTANMLEETKVCRALVLSGGFASSEPPDWLPPPPRLRRDLAEAPCGAKAGAPLVRESSTASTAAPGSLPAA